MKKKPFIPLTKNAPVEKPQEAGRAPTVQELLNEGHARLRRIDGDKLYVGSLLDTFAAEIVQREEALANLRQRLAKYEGQGARLPAGVY